MKKVLATILALIMALGLCSVSWADTTLAKKWKCQEMCSRETPKI